MKGYRQAVENTVFVYNEARPFRVLSLGNCQAEHHAQLARIALQDCSADYILVHMANDPERAAEVEAFLDSAEGRYDLIFGFDLQDKWGPVSRTALEARYGRDRLFYIPNLTFLGPHPDMTSLGGLGARVIGPLGNYHSRIAVGAWLAGVDLDTTLRLFTGGGFERLNYFARFDAALAEFRRREQTADFSFAGTMMAHMRDQIGFFTQNHPTPAMFTTFMADLREALVRAGRARSSGVTLDSGYIHQSLVEFGSAPIFPEIAEAAGFRHGGGRDYLLPRLGGGYPIPLKEFIARSFQSYDRTGRDVVMETTQSAECLALVREAV